MAQDQFGNVFLVDRNGNMYYDTGDKRYGMLMVSRKRQSRAAADQAVHSAVAYKRRKYQVNVRGLDHVLYAGCRLIGTGTCSICSPTAIISRSGCL